MKMNRYFLELAYKGTRYHGWQIQKNALSVQEVVENAISTILRNPIPVTGSGRTDTGVHASQQFLHFDVGQKLDRLDFLKRVNSLLPKDIAAYSLRQVKPDAHARFDAEWRSYVYKINLQKNPFEQETSWLYFQTLDLMRMNEAAELLLQQEDFECFSKVHTAVNNFNCKIKTAHWEQKGPYLQFHITANRFLRGMVRAIVGTMTEVGTHKCDLYQFKQILASKNRSHAGSAAPPQGLFLCQVTYPESIFI